MANETGLDSSGISSSVPALLRTKALKARYAASMVWKHCMNGLEGDPFVKGAINKFGDTVTFQIMPSITVQDISTTDGSITRQEISPTQGTITIDSWKGAEVFVVDIVDAQSVIQWQDELSDAFGKAVSEAQDTSILALVANLTTNAQGDTNAFSDPKVLLAQRTLDTAKVPRMDRTWAISPTAEADLMTNDKFVIASATGFQRGLQVEGGRITGLYGTPVVVTPLVTPTSAQLDNVLFHKEAFGVVMQKDFKFEVRARTSFGTTYAASALYGVATLRDNHAVRSRSGA